MLSYDGDQQGYPGNYLIFIWFICIYTMVTN